MIKFIKDNWFRIILLILIYLFIREISNLSHLNIDIYHYEGKDNIADRILQKYGL